MNPTPPNQPSRAAKLADTFVEMDVLFEPRDKLITLMQSALDEERQEAEAELAAANRELADFIDSFGVDPEDGSVRRTPSEMLSSMKADLARLTAQVRELTEAKSYLETYVVPEKDKHGKYWHDLAQERIATVARLTEENAKLVEALGHIEGICDKPSEVWEMANAALLAARAAQSKTKAGKE